MRCIAGREAPMVLDRSGFGPTPKTTHIWKERKVVFLAPRKFLALAAGLTLLVTVPQVAAANGPVPFRPTTSETVAVVPCDPNLCLSITGPGQATQLGKVTRD